MRHQSLIVHSRSKVVHVYSLLHDEWNTAGRLGTFIALFIVVTRQVNIMIKKTIPIISNAKKKWGSKSVFCKLEL